MDRKSRTSRSASLEESNEEASLWKEICTSLVKLESIQREAGNVIANINKTAQTSRLIDNGIPSSLYQRLKDCYRDGITLSSSEIKTINDIIEKVSVLIALRDASEYNGIDGKRKKRKHDSIDDRSTTSTATTTTFSIAPSNKKGKTQILPVNTLVAASPLTQKDTRNDEWILARVLQFHTDKNRYHIEDVDRDEYGNTQRYMVSPRQVIPIPDITDNRLEYPSGHHVLALYPGTTCFYKATVMVPPSKNKDMNAIGTYKVQFEDDNNEIKYANPNHVLETPTK